MGFERAQFQCHITVKKKVPMTQQINQSQSESHPLNPEVFLGKVLGEVSTKLSDGQDFTDILDFLFNTLNIIIPYERIGIALVEEESNPPLICSKWLRTKLPKVYLGENYCAPIQGTSLERILKTGQPRIINDLLEYTKDHKPSKSTELILKEGIRSSLTCPLKAEGKRMGIVFFSSSKPDTYRHEHIDTYLKIADELSVIIEQFRLRNWFHEDASRVRNMRMLLHDLKNPLTVMKTFLTISEKQSWFQNLGEDAKRVFDTLKRNSEFMQELIEELSDLQKLGADKNNLEPREVSLHSFIPNLAIRAREQASRKDNTVTIKTGANLPEMAHFDVTQIHRVIDNLVSNAFKFSHRGSNVTINITKGDGRIIFEVTDEGQGIPEDEMSKLFSEFGRTSVQPTEGEKSTGLGLAISKKIVEQHGGEISVRSQVGKGSTFSFWIPMNNVLQ